MKNLILLTALLLNGCYAVAQQYVQKQDTPIINVLVNPGFENAKGGYTFSASSTATIVTGANAIQGSASLRFDSTAASQTVRTALYTMPSTKRTGSVSECQGDLRYSTNESTNKYLFNILNASGTVISTKILEPVSIATTAINFFTCTPSAMGEVISTGSALFVDLDSLHLGSRKDLLKIDVTESLGYEPVANVTGTNPITITGTASSPVVVLNQSGAVSGSTYTKVAVDGFGRVTSGTTIINSDLPDTGVAASTYTKVAVNTKGVITSGTILLESDVPSLQTTKITSGIFGIAFGGTGVSTTTTGNLLVGSGTALVNFPKGASGTILSSNNNTLAWTSAAALSSIPPTVQKFTTASGTYTTPVGVRYIRVTMVGGGGGGGGSGTGAGGGNSGTNTTFGTTLLSANAGTGGNGGVNGKPGGGGGTASLGTGPIGLALSGAAGNGTPNLSLSGVGGAGGSGGNSALGGGGNSTPHTTAGSAGIANTGGGGSGGAGGGTVATSSGAGGGGAGGYVSAFITAPSATYPYVVGSGGNGASAGTDGLAGGNGGSGVIVVEEYY